MSRSRDLANLAGDATGLETLTVSDITDLTATAAELNKLDGVTADTAEINKLDGVTADTAELNKLDGVTASTAELNYVDGVTSAVQTQLTQLNSQTSPHIIPGVLYPAVGGKGIDGTTTVTSFGTDFAISGYPTLKYYYTDIKGSKPIKDPRIGGHFGSQRHKFKSLQLLEQETATHGDDVFSIDGREWCRAVGEWSLWADINVSGSGIIVPNSSTTSFIEIVGYFSTVNYIAYADDNDRSVRITIDGGNESGTVYGGALGAGNPLGDRYVDSGMLHQLTTSTLGLHTIKIRKQGTGATTAVNAIELIAQDTTSTANRSKIQIPSQNVVSYGKKFTVSAEGSSGHHYDPFNGFTSGSSVTSYIDTATSLGVENWKESSTYYRPYNGGRVVKWVDSSGVIKTSVTLMPPNAKSIADSSSLTNGTAKANASIANNTFYPTFEAHTTDVNEDQLHEIAKTFHFREFGNGSANGGTGATFADASMLTTTTDNIAYVMDDGLTSLSARDVQDQSSYGAMLPQTSDVYNHFTFIGTGIAVNNKSTNLGAIPFNQIAQNLPYGTHIFGISRNASQTHSSLKIDGVVVDTDFNSGGYGSLTEVSFNQPKRPPIPEDACVLADYMLMADFKPQTTAGTQLISKGVRRQNISRDVFFDETDGDSFTFTIDPASKSGGFVAFLSGTADSDTSMKMRIPSFGTNCVNRGYQNDTRSKLFVGDTDNDSASTKDNTASHGSYAYLTSDLTLGVHQFGSNSASGQNGNIEAFDIVTPIHTSHHYQTFETPFLYELVGGDRNMEQTNLVVSPDGKTWDEVTRDTSYIGNSVLTAKLSADVTNEATLIFDDFRGIVEGSALGNKDFAIAYDRFICLRDGGYNFSWSFEIQANGAAGYARMALNGTYVMHATADNEGSGRGNMSASLNLQLKRGDYVSFPANYYIEGTDQFRQVFSVTRI